MPSMLKSVGDSKAVSFMISRMAGIDCFLVAINKI